MRTEPVIVLGERGRLPHLTLLACTIHADRIEAKAYILHAALPRGRTLARLQRTGGTWTVPRGALHARPPRLMPPDGQTGHVSLHRGLTIPLTRNGK